MDTDTIANCVAWSCSLIVTIVSIRVAQAFLLHNVRLFTSMALFSLAWALLLPYYGSTSQSELFPALSGFLLVHVGEFLKKRTEVGILDRLSLFLLAIIVTPNKIELLHPNQLFEVISKDAVEVFLATFLTVIGFASLVMGGRFLFSTLEARIVTILASLYSLLELSFLYSVFDFSGATESMSLFYKYSFALAKIVFVPVFVWFVAINGMTEEDKRKTLIEKLLKIVGG